MKKQLGMMIVCSGLFLSAPAWAGNGDLPGENRKTQAQVGRDAVMVTAHLGVGYLNGDATELVYDADTGHKNSELQWELDNVYMLNAGLAVSPSSWFTLSADFWINLNKGNGVMDDYDFLSESYNGFTDWSHHEDTDLTKGFMCDLNAAFTFYTFDETRFSALVGYKHDNWKWEARGGSYVYSTFSFFDDVGSFPPGEKGITYTQWFHVPYLGLAFESTLGKVFFTGRIIASPLVYAKDEDIHHLRNLRFEGDFDVSSMYGVDLGVGYDITPNFAVLAAFKYQKYEEAKGDVTSTDLVTGEQEYYGGDSAGIDHSSYMVSLGLRYRF